MTSIKNKPNAEGTAVRRIIPENAMSIRDMLMVCLGNWPWFVLSLIISMGAVTLYLLSTPKGYVRTTSIMVKSSGEKSNEIKLIEELGVSNISSNISDEIVAVHSPAVIAELVKRLRLEVSYYSPGVLRDEPCYAETLPVEAEFHDLGENAFASFTIALNGDGTAELTDFEQNGEKKPGNLQAKVGKTYKTPIGRISLKPTLYYDKAKSEKIIVKRSGYAAAAQHFGSLISAALQPGTRNIIDITCVDNSIPRADNILRTIVSIYNENWVKNRNQVNISTNEFIRERIAVLESELGTVESNLASYKSAHRMVDVEQMATSAYDKENTALAEQQDIENKTYMIRYVRNYVKDPAHAKQLIPAGTGIDNSEIEAQIAEFNTKVLERTNLVSNSSEQNPLVADIDVTLKNLRSSIIKSLDNAETTLNSRLKIIQSSRDEAQNQISEAPQHQNHLLSIERQQKVKETLYLFLLQKREENELSQAFTAYNTQLIAAPWGSAAPAFPNEKRLILLAFAIGVALPAAYFIIKEMSDTKVRGRKDFENLTIPYVGELPLWRAPKGEKLEKEYNFVVKLHSRDITNEAYRVVRTNLEYMTGVEKNCKVIMLTSFNPGSGKTFITANLGASFAIRGSRVVCIDLDLRRGSLSEFVDKPSPGLTDYLSGKEDAFEHLIVRHSLNANADADNKDGDVPHLDFLPIGKIPPNPTELLYSPRLMSMMEALQQQYDYIFLDCPPVDIVADATIISHIVDITLFVIRSGLMDRSMLPELQKDYDDKKYNNMALLLNGTSAEHRYGYHRYGYGRYGYGRYGYGRYGYGKYGYGRYGYGYGHSKKKK